MQEWFLSIDIGGQFLKLRKVAIVLLDEKIVQKNIVDRLHTSFRDKNEANYENGFFSCYDKAYKWVIL